ncbi:hypothetical protein D1007_59950 [Hordeum vulgare]|nr:hypothetical protein D1007_59950 [Hordeum vulgare]
MEKFAILDVMEGFPRGGVNIGQMRVSKEVGSTQPPCGCSQGSGRAGRSPGQGLAPVWPIFGDLEASDEHPLTEYKKVRARNMMRNNRIFQSLGIDAIASMIRKTNDVQEGTTNGVQEGSGVISDHPEYNPKEDEVVVHKTVKALKESRKKRPGVKKTASKKRKSSEASAAMPPGRVMTPPPGKTKRILEPDEPDKVTRQEATMAAATDHQESPLGMDFESSMEMRDEFSLYLNL